MVSVTIAYRALVYLSKEGRHIICCTDGNSLIATISSEFYTSSNYICVSSFLDLMLTVLSAWQNHALSTTISNKLL